MSSAKDQSLRLLVAATLVALTTVTLAPVLDNGFISLDDGRYVTANPRLLGGFTSSTLQWIFTTFHAANWHPVTWLSHLADVALFGLRPRGHHLTSLLLHAANALLCLCALRLMTGSIWRSALAAAYFAVHPLRVESVAWIAERKDVLCGLFWMAALAAYASYVRRPHPARYLLLATTFSLGLMAKPMALTLPFVLLLLDWWPLGRAGALPGRDPRGPRGLRLRTLILEKAPLFALSAASTAVTFLAQSAGQMVKSAEHYPAGIRIVNALAAYAAYLGKTLWPARLGLPYPHPGAALPAWQWVAALALLLSLSAVAVAAAGRRPWLTVGWLWFLGTLVPVIGLVQLADQSMADRYTYLPGLGLAIAAAWAFPAARRARPPCAVGLRLGAGLALAALALICRRQAGFWRDDVTLFGRTLLVTADNALAAYNLGTGLARRGDVAAAIPRFREALRLRPGFGEAHYNLGKALEETGNDSAAAAHYLEALRAMPDYLYAINNLGGVLLRSGRADEAKRWYSRAVSLSPGDPELRCNLGRALAAAGDAAAARAQFREALRLSPGHAGAAAALRTLDAGPAR